MYTRKSYKFKKSIEREEYHTPSQPPPGYKRGQRKKPTKEEMEKVNRRNKVKKAERMIKANFSSGDYWTTLTYKPEEKPLTMEAAKDDFQKFQRKLRTRYKKEGEELKYWAWIEIGKKGGIHVHLIVNRVQKTDLLLAELWTKGKIHNELMYEDTDGGFKQLVQYATKEPGEKNENGKPNGMKEKWESHSRNLKEPEMKKEIMKAGTFRKGIKEPKGYYLDKDSLEEGVNPFTGFKYRRYTLIKIEEDKKCKKSTSTSKPQKPQSSKRQATSTS